ncbi:hypothetical protein BGZ94_003188, partial [Podila epigama]
MVSVTVTGGIQASLLALLALSFLDSTQAHSSPWPAITRSEHILDIRHDILPRTTSNTQYRNNPLAKRKTDSSLNVGPEMIVRGDTVRLQFSAYNTTFHLYLEPNHDLIHPDANLGDDMTLDDIKAFKGVVLQDNYFSDRRWDRALSTSRESSRTIEHLLHEEGVLGWARMMIEHDPTSKDEIILRGAFTVEGDTYHVTSRQHYKVQKRSDDAVPSTASISNLVIYRDSDLYKPSQRQHKRGLNQEFEEPACGADKILRAGSNSTGVLTTPYGHYYPPDLTSKVPVLGGFEMSSSPWLSTMKTPLVKRVAGPNPVPPGCPTNRLVNYMGVAADCAYTRSFGGVIGARKQILADFNTASGIYESTFNVALGVITLNIESENCPATIDTSKAWNRDCSPSYTIDQRLSDFSQWRGASGRANDGAGLWHLMTRCNSGSVVGIAWTKQLCVQRTSSQRSSGQSTQYTSGTGVSSVTPNSWMVVAHEIAHGFGAVHDCTASACASSDDCCPLSSTSCDAGARYIMNPSEQTETRVFSPCSIQTICSTIQGPNGQCLQPPGSRNTQSSQDNICGNGIRESGEECDCGSAEECAADPCCDGATCKFKGGAVCDDLNDSCCENCQIKSAGAVCREAISECDIQEVCTGTSAICPEDVRIKNGTPCQGSNNATGLQCANGVCTSRDLQCQLQGRRGITKSCGASNSCDLLCNDPSGSSMTCMQIPDTYFLDGTPCGFGGNCAGGECKYSNGVNGILDWARRHLAIVIPVGVVVGLILLCCIWSCCISPLVNKRRQKKLGLPKPGRRPHHGNQVQNATGAHQGHPTGPTGHYGPDAYPGAEHAGQIPMQQYQSYPGAPLPPVPPAPVYYSEQWREEYDLQRALTASRLEHEAQMRHQSSSSQHEATGGIVNPNTGAAASFSDNNNSHPVPGVMSSPASRPTSPPVAPYPPSGSIGHNHVPQIANPFEDQSS